MNNDQLRIAIAFFFIAWAFVGIALTWYVKVRGDRLIDDDNGNGGDDSDDPYHYDPDDPQDWWKKDKVNK